MEAVKLKVFLGTLNDMEKECEKLQEHGNNAVSSLANLIKGLVVLIKLDYQTRIKEDEEKNSRINNYLQGLNERR